MKFPLARIALILLLCLACHPSRSGRLLLSDQLEHSDDQNLVAYQGPLGKLAANPYLVGPWAPGLEDGSVVPLDDNFCGLRFYLKEPVALELEIEGFHHNQAPVLFSQLHLNQQPLKAVQLRREKQRLQFELPADQLKPGVNTLRLGPARDSRWGEVRLQPAYRPQPFQPESPKTLDSSGDEIKIPYSGSRQFSLQLSGTDRALLIDNVHPWDEQGAAPGQSASLLVRASHPSGFEARNTVRSGDSLNLRLPDELDRVTLCFTAVSSQRPLKGQIGVQLRKPRIEFQPSSHVSSPLPAVEIESGPVSDPVPRPNLIIYLIDTLRADHLSCYGYHRQTSPNIDALAAEGFLFQQVSAHSPWTKPTTATLLTGLHPREHGATDWGDILPNEVETVAEILVGRGYETRAFVTNNFASGLFGITQGFQQESLLPEMPAAEVTERVAAWLGDRTGQAPFFLYVHTLDPHSPYEPPERFNRWSQRRVPIETQHLEDESARLAPDPGSGKPSRPSAVNDAIDLYDGEILANDEAFGKLIQALKLQGEYDNSVIIVVSDHGEEFFEHYGFGHCRTLYPEVLGVPWVMKLPQQMGAGTVVKGEWQQLDVVPSALAALGVSPTANMEGLVFNPETPQAPRSRAISLHAEVGPDNGLLEHKELLRMEGVRRDSWLYLRHRAQTHPASEPEELFELGADPTAASNLVLQRSDQVGLMRAVVKRLAEVVEVAAPTKMDPARVEKLLRDLQYL